MILRSGQRFNASAMLCSFVTPATPPVATECESVRGSDWLALDDGHSAPLALAM